jgi:hypothetical protein
MATDGKIKRTVVRSRSTRQVFVCTLSFARRHGTKPPGRASTRQSPRRRECVASSGLPAWRSPVEIIDKLNKEINTGLADTKIIARVAELGLTVLAGSPADFEKLIADDTEKWAKVVKFSGARPD